MDVQHPAHLLLRPDVLAQNSPELTRIIVDKDWSKTPLGPIAAWTPALRGTVEQVLSSGYAQLLWWGPQHTQIYNDAYRPVLGTKHPYALGMTGPECWSEIWDILKPLVDQPYRTGRPSVTDDLKLFIHRYGFDEETHFTVAYSPVFDETVEGGIGGVLAIVHETTEKVVAARRLQLLRELGTSTAGTHSPREVIERAVAALSQDRDDLAFAQIYLLDHTGDTATLAASFGDAPFKALHTVAAIEEMLGRTLGTVNSAMLAQGVVFVPLAASLDGMPGALLVAGPSASHAFDDAYFQFFDLIAAPITSAILNAIAAEAERERTRALEELDRAKNAFFSNVSHEFRTPLTLMLGPLADLTNAQDDVTRDLAETARRNALRLLKLVNTLLEFSRLQAGRNDAAFVATDLATLTRQLVGVFGSAFESAGLALHVDVDLKERVYVDRSMWERIVLNLISNAIKFTLHGSVTVALHADGDAAQLTVTDTGIGIPSSELPHVFERFRRVRNAVSRSHEGSGIGLALVKDLVELHGGTINVSSKQGIGTTFTVRIPFGDAHLDPERVLPEGQGDEYASSVDQYVAEMASTMHFTSSPPVHRVVADVPVDGKRVLLVDDNADLLDYLSSILSKRYHVTTARNGVEAYELLREQAFDVIVSDVMMPLMDGFELLRAVRADESMRTTPFIMLTARAGDSSAVEGLTAGADDYLTKPFNTDDLVARVYAQIHGASLRQEAMHRLKASEDRFRTLASSLPSIVIEADASGNLTFVNEAFLAYTGRTAEETYEQGWGNAVHPDDAPAVRSSWIEHLQSGRPYEREMRLRRHDGVYRWHFVRAIPLRDAEGRIERWTGTANDFHDRRLALDERQLLADASQILLQARDVGTTLRAFARFAVPRIADWCQIDLARENGEIVTVAIVHRDPEKDRIAQELVGRIHLNPDAPRGTPYTIRTGRADLVPDVTMEMLESAITDEAELEFYRALGITSGISVPIVADGKVLGAFTCAIDSVERKYTQDDLEVVSELGRRAAVAIVRAEAFEREHRVAESFQEASLPLALPSVPGVTFDAVYVAGKSEAQVGGDWYDAMRLLDGRLVISIGDVAGSGLGAAVLMGNMRQIIRGIAQVHADPALMLDAADRALRLEHPEQFVTAFVAVLDPIARTLTYASAGHPPALLRRPDGTVEPLSDGGLPLGLRRYHATKQSTMLTIEDGSLVVLYTDGLTEIDRDALKGEGRLIDVLHDPAVVQDSKPAWYIRESFLDGSLPHDDVAILAMRFEGGIALAPAEVSRRFWSFDAGDAHAARVSRSEFSTLLGSLGVGPEDLYAAELVFGELVGNVVRYAPGIVDITLDYSASPSVLHVMDRGRGFRHNAILPADLYSESGRGLFIVSSLTQDFHVMRRADGGSHARAVLSINTRRTGELQGSLLQSLLR